MRARGGRGEAVRRPAGLQGGLGRALGPRTLLAWPAGVGEMGRGTRSPGRRQTPCSPRGDLTVLVAESWAATGRALGRFALALSSASDAPVVRLPSRLPVWSKGLRFRRQEISFLRTDTQGWPRDVASTLAGNPGAASLSGLRPRNRRPWGWAPPGSALLQVLLRGAGTQAEK